MPIDRSAFLYLEPKSPKHKENFAQCSDCKLWLGEEKKLCSIHGPNLEVLGSMTCCLYVEGEPDSEQKVTLAVTPKESGLEDREVRCENCTYFRRNSCGLFDILNSYLSEEFDLPTKVIAKGCCNANTPKEKSKKKDDAPFNMV